MRFALVLLTLSGCASPPLAQAQFPTGRGDGLRGADSTFVGVAEGDTLLNRTTPPYPYPAAADSLREVMRNQILLFIPTTVHVSAVDSNGQPIPIDDLLASVKAELPTESHVVVQLRIAWDGTVIQAIAGRVYSDVPVARGPIERAIRAVRSTPPYDEQLAEVLPPGIPSYSSGGALVEFRGPR